MSTKKVGTTGRFGPRYGTRTIKIVTAMEKKTKKKQICPYCERPTLKRVALIHDEFDNEICSTAFCVLRAIEEKIDPEFLYYVIQRNVFIENLGTIQRGASYPAVTDKDVKTVKNDYVRVTVTKFFTEKTD